MKKPKVDVSREVLEHINPYKAVYVYRNLHKKCLSVKQGNLVICHTGNVVMKDCEFIIYKAGQKRVREENKKNVHAFVKGFVINARETDHIDSGLTDEALELGCSNWEELYYNPYVCDGFMDPDNGKIAKAAKFVDISADEGSGPFVLAFNIEYDERSR